MSVGTGRCAVSFLASSLLLLLLLGLQHASAKPFHLPSNRARQVENSTGTFVTGPVIPSNFPDPCITYANGEWWAFATMDSNINIQVARSPDFSTWTYLDGVDALPSPPGWVDMAEPNTWAPDVNQLVSVFYCLGVFCSVLSSLGVPFFFVLPFFSPRPRRDLSAARDRRFPFWDKKHKSFMQTAGSH